MVLQRLENVGYKNKCEVNAYLLGLEEGIEELQKRNNIWLWGAGQNGYYDTQLGTFTNV